MSIEPLDLVGLGGRDLPSLTFAEVHLFRVTLDQPSRRVRALKETLTPAEQERYNRIRRSVDRRAFCVSHAFLRVILGRYTSMPPEQIRFVSGPFGKPLLDPAIHRSGIAFNLSHSGSVALIAVAVDRRIGVDVQRFDSVATIDNIASRAFSPDEKSSIESLPEEARIPSFYACWTRKEAAVKALGGSIALLSLSVIVSTAPGEPAQLVRMPDEDEQTVWQLSDLPVGEGYAAALCYSGAPAAIVLREFTG